MSVYTKQNSPINFFFFIDSSLINISIAKAIQLFFILYYFINAIDITCFILVCMYLKDLVFLVILTPTLS